MSLQDATFDDFTAAVRGRQPKVGVILGSGMGSVRDGAEEILSLSYGCVPGLRAPGVPGHRGRLTLAQWGGRCVLVFEGRVHAYEGRTRDEVVAPVRLAHALGIGTLLFTNAAGGIGDALQPGCLMAVRGQRECFGLAGWVGRPLNGDSCHLPKPYCPRLLSLLRHSATAVGIDLHDGVYAAVTGPCYETPAEIRALKALGVDAVGMSTAVEARVAHELGMSCAAISCITNRAAGLAAGTIDHEEVLKTTACQSGKLAKLIERWIGLVSQPSSSQDLLDHSCFGDPR